MYFWTPKRTKGHNLVILAHHHVQLLACFALPNVVYDPQCADSIACIVEIHRNKTPNSVLCKRKRVAIKKKLRRVTQAQTCLCHVKMVLSQPTGNTQLGPSYYFTLEEINKDRQHVRRFMVAQAELFPHYRVLLEKPRFLRITGHTAQNAHFILRNGPNFAVAFENCSFLPRDAMLSRRIKSQPTFLVMAPSEF